VIFGDIWWLHWVSQRQRTNWYYFTLQCCNCRRSLV